jgi:hypothetical protein
MYVARLAFILTVLATVSLAAAGWPHWRGPNGTGATNETNLPVRWSRQQPSSWRASAEPPVVVFWQYRQGVLC